MSAVVQQLPHGGRGAAGGRANLVPSGGSSRSWINYHRYYNLIHNENMPGRLQEEDSGHWSAADDTSAKFNLDLARDAVQWVQAVTGRPLTPPSGDIKDQYDVQDVLKDGKGLCELINKIFPGSVRKVNNSKLPFKERENIEMFLRACQSNGMKDVDLFQVDDLYEGKSMYTVINCIHTLGSIAQSVSGFNGPSLGIRHSQQNRRQFTEETLNQGKNMIGLQMGVGTDKVATQSGMTAPGTYRHM